MAEIDSQKFKKDNGNFWVGGANTSSEPENLPVTQFSWGINVDNKNGVISTRDGWTPIIRSPSGKAQMLAHFRDCRNLDWIVWAVAGRLYASPYPFVQYRDLGIQLNPNSDFFTHTVVERGARRVGPTQEGTRRRELMRPLRYLVISDDTNKPVYWSGGLVVCTINDAPVGKWLAFASNRLFIAGGQLKEEIWWSDIADPISFHDIGFLADGGQFRLRSNVTGLCPSPDGQSLYAFESGQTWRLAVGMKINRESDWKTTEGFQKILFPDIGCLAGKSFVKHFGDLWWWSNRDLMSIGRASSTYQTDEVLQSDLEMTRSREKFTAVKDNVVGVSHENYFLLNTPVNEIWAKNNSPVSLLNENTPSAWLGIWTGYRVKEFCSFTGQEDGELYTFALSTDLDNSNRIYRLFNGTQKDGLSRIKSSVEFRGHSFQDLGKPKRFRWFDMNIGGLWGDVDLKGWYRGFKGGWKQVLSKTMKASPDFYDGAKVVQTRKIWSQENFGMDLCSACDTNEGASGIDQIDYMFQIMLQWEGQMSVDSYRIAIFEEVEQLSGRCEEDEETATIKQVCGRPESLDYVPIYSGLLTPLYVTPDTNTDCDLCPGTIPDPPRTYTSNQSCTKICLDGTGPAVTRTATGTSSISQFDADTQALNAACALAQAALVCTWTSTQSCTVECPPGTVGGSVTKTSTYTSSISQADADSNALAAACAAANAELQCSTPAPLLVVAGQVFDDSTGTTEQYRVGSLLNNGRYDTSWNGGKVTTAISGALTARQGLGGFFGGFFSTYNGVSAPGLVKLFPDGTRDTAFIYGPYTSSWSGSSTSGILNILDMEIGSDGFLAMVGNIYAWNGQLVYRPDKTVGTPCTNYCNATTGYLLINPVNGSILSTNYPSFAGPNPGGGNVTKVKKALGTSSRYIAGRFNNTFGGTFNPAIGVPEPSLGAANKFRPYLAKLNFDGSLDESFIGLDNTGPLSSTWQPKGPHGQIGKGFLWSETNIMDMHVLPNGNLIIAGDFEGYGLMTRPGVAVVDGNTGLLNTTFDFPFISGVCTAVTSTNDYIYVAEKINNGGGTKIHKYSFSGQADMEFENANVIASGNNVTKMFPIGNQLAIVGSGSITANGVLAGPPDHPYTSGVALISLEDGSPDLNFRSSSSWYQWYVTPAGNRRFNGASLIQSAAIF